MGIDVSKGYADFVILDQQNNLKRNKTDKISAQSVAEYLISHPEKTIYQQEDSLAGLRKQ